MIFGLTRRLKRGSKLMLFLTFKCTINCDYCSLGYFGKRVTSAEISLDDWKYLVESFPVKLREIRISGGEPMLMPYYSDLINWLLDRGLHVIVYTNLSVLKLDVHKSYRLIYIATYHKGLAKHKFIKNLSAYQKFYNVQTHQIDDETILNIKVGPLCYSEYAYTCAGFMYDPAGNLYRSFDELLEGKDGR
jgi:organic radical activating enzyme